MNPIGTISDASGEELIVQRGISQILLKEVYRLSHAPDPDLQHFTDDSHRFASPESIQSWLGDTSRQVYVITPNHHPEMLAGLAWLREDRTMHCLETVHDEVLASLYQSAEMRYTIAARLYPDFRGRRLAVAFMTVVQEDYLQSIQAKTFSILAIIHRDNVASQKLFERLGYGYMGTERDRMMWTKVFS